MAIWSLTREKVEKLLREVSNKELEIDELLKLSPKQLWATDLDTFIEEWRHALDEDKRRAQEGTVKKKRGGKLGFKGAKGKKKADDEDSDYEAKMKKKTAAKAKADVKKQSTLGFKPVEKASVNIDKKPVRAAKKETPFIEELSDDDFGVLEQNVAKAKPAAATKPEKAPSMELLSSSPAAAEKIGGLSKRTGIFKPESDDDDDGDVFMDEAVTAEVPKKNVKGESEDDFEYSEVEKPTKKKAAKGKVAAKPAAKAKATAKIDNIFDDSDDVPPSRAATNKPKRAAAAKKPVVAIESDLSDDDDGLGDVSAMVKGVGGGGGAVKPLFKQSPAKAKAPVKSAASKKAVPKPAQKKPINLDTDDEDDDDAGKQLKTSRNMLPSDLDDVVPIKLAAKPPAKKAAPAKAAATKKVAPPKKVTAKPTAKGRAKKTVDESDDELDVDATLEQLLDSDEDIAEPEPRPVSRGRAARAKVSYKIDPVDSDDDDDDDASEDFDDDSE